MLINNWITSIKEIANKELVLQGDRLNAYYCIDIINPLIRLCKEFPLWSAVMVDAFKSPNIVASSAIVEGYFHELKSSVISKKMPRMRIDKFVVTNLRSIRGTVKLAKVILILKHIKPNKIIIVELMKTLKI